MKTLLFFDDMHLNQAVNLYRQIGAPKLLQTLSFYDDDSRIAWSYPSVFFDQHSAKWRMTYQHCGTTFPRVALLAESTDGEHWHKRDTTPDLVFANRQRCNQLIPTEEFSEWSATFFDERAPEEERLKGFVVKHVSDYHLQAQLWTSPDGLHWKPKKGAIWQSIAPDPATCAYFNHVTGKYTIISRPDWTDRRLAMHETEDWIHYTDQKLVLQADALDTPLAQLYGMQVFSYEGMFIGFLWVYHPMQEVLGGSPHKFYGGRVDCQLAYSLNGTHFQRGIRTPLFENIPDSPYSGCIYPTSVRTMPDGSLRIYASASTHEHAHDEGKMSILTFELRQDGFVGLRSSGGCGIAGTRPLLYMGGDIQLNVKCQGSVRAQITDYEGKTLLGYSFSDCQPFTGDSIAWVPHFKEKNVEDLTGKLIRLEIALDGAILYAIRGNLHSLYAGQCWRFEHEGEIPKERLGFD